MPRVKAAVITLRDGTILCQGNENIEYGDNLITTYKVEMIDVEVMKKDWRGKDTKTVLRHEQREGKVPVMSWPYNEIKRIDWGYIGMEEFTALKKIVDEQKAKAKQAADAKKGGQDGRVGTDTSASGRATDK